MALLPPINRIVKEDFKDEPWAEKLLWPINRFFESVVQALNRNITISENMRGFVKQLTITGGSYPIQFTPDMPGNVTPTDVWVTSMRRVDGTTTTSAVSIDWEIASNSQIQINNITGLTSGEKYIARFIVLAEPLRS